MCPLGKTMKIAHLHHQPEKKAQNYRDTPHPATDVSPAAMVFRDDKKTFQENQSQKKSIKKSIKVRSRDGRLKQQRTEQINCSKY